jgi:curved DNA-binding protein
MPMDTPQKTKPRAGADQERKVEVTLQEAYRGTTRLVELASGRRFTVKIPPGVETGTRVRFAGYGLSGRAGGARGDLYLRIAVRPCPGFARQGDDLYHQCSLNLAELALGTDARIRTLNERLLALTVPAGTPPGEQFRLAGEGMPRLRNPTQRGDLYVTINVKLPPELKKLVRELKTRPAQASPEADSFAVVFLTVLFVAGIGAGLLLYWLIFD